MQANLPELTAHAEIIIWILVAVITFLLMIFIPSTAYFLVREFSRKDKNEDRMDENRKELTKMFQEGMDKFSTALDDVGSAVDTLRGTLNDFRFWSSERFIPRAEFEDTIERLETTLKDNRAWAEKEVSEFKSYVKDEFKRCKEFCPVRQNQGGK